MPCNHGSAISAVMLIDCCVETTDLLKHPSSISAFCTANRWQDSLYVGCTMCACGLYYVCSAVANWQHTAMSEDFQLELCLRMQAGGTHGISHQVSMAGATIFGPRGLEAWRLRGMLLQTRISSSSRCRARSRVCVKRLCCPVGL